LNPGWPSVRDLPEPVAFIGDDGRALELTESSFDDRDPADLVREARSHRINWGAPNGRAWSLLRGRAR
jgi:hypothetical protein